MTLDRPRHWAGRSRKHNGKGGTPRAKSKRYDSQAQRLQIDFTLDLVAKAGVPTIQTTDTATHAVLAEKARDSTSAISISLTGQSDKIHMRSVKCWRPRPESNRGARICSPLRHHSATWPKSHFVEANTLVARTFSRSPASHRRSNVTVECLTSRSYRARRREAIAMTRRDAEPH